MTGQQGVTSKISLDQWLTKYGRRPNEDETRVIAACTCEESGYNPEGTCEGWVLTYADSVYPHERMLTEDERAAAGLPPYPHTTRGVY